uniref:PHD and ring finger domains 1 n=1 Tax=Neolamprologus brichardi TaxID=32507 RepID=A0A3Q4GJ04_NEOBR
EDDDVRHRQVADVDTEGRAMDRSPVLNTAGAESLDLMCDSVKCYICLNPFEKQTVGSLENCQHVFCLECILQWSQTANTCPVDRISFTLHYILSVRKNEDGGDEEEGSSAAVICEECGRGDRRHRLLVCILCDSGYHMHCLRPTLNTRPEGDWVCPECAVTPHVTGKSV